MSAKRRKVDREPASKWPTITALEAANTKEWHTNGVMLRIRNGKSLWGSAEKVRGHTGIILKRIDVVDGNQVMEFTHRVHPDAILELVSTEVNNAME